MNLSEIITNRHSVREYLPQKVEQQKLNEILEAGRMAPTAANFQPVRVIAVQSEAGLEKLNRAANTYGAPLALIVCADKNTAWKRPFDGKITTDIDASIVTDHIMLKATELGLGSVWICYFKPDVLKEEFNIPENYEVVNILAVGYSDEKTTPIKRRKDMSEFALLV